VQYLANEKTGNDAYNIQDFPFTWAGDSAFGREILPGDDMATMKAKVEKQVARLTPHFWWKDDDSLEVHEHVPGRNCPVPDSCSALNLS